jgi:hypothetical protein
MRVRFECLKRNICLFFIFVLFAFWLFVPLVHEHQDTENHSDCPVCALINQIASLEALAGLNPAIVIQPVQAQAPQPDTSLPLHEEHIVLFLRSPPSVSIL